MLSGKKAQYLSDKNIHPQRGVWSIEEVPSEKVGLFTLVMHSVTPACQSSFALPPHLRRLTAYLQYQSANIYVSFRASAALVLNNPQHLSSESDDDIPTMFPRASTSRTIFPTSTEDPGLIGNANTHLTDGTYQPSTPA